MSLGSTIGNGNILGATLENHCLSVYIPLNKKVKVCFLSILVFCETFSDYVKGTMLSSFSDLGDNTDLSHGSLIPRFLPSEGDMWKQDPRSLFL